MLRTTFLVLILLALGGGCDLRAETPPVVPAELINLGSLNLQGWASRDMSLVTSSYTATNPSGGDILATITVATGKTGYILGYRCAGSVQGRMDLYTSATQVFNSAFFGDFSDTGWIFCPNWKSLSATAGTSLSVRVPASLTGVYSATILVGESVP